MIQLSGLLRLVLICCLLLPATAAAQSDFDPYEHTVLGLRLGMTHAEVVQALDRAGLSLVSEFDDRELEQNLGARRLQLPTLDGQELTYRLREFTQLRTVPQFSLNFTHPTPGDPQLLWAMTYRTRFSAETDVEEIVAGLVERYGEPTQSNSSFDGRDRTLLYGDLLFDPLFDSNANASAGNIGMYIEVRAPTAERPVGVLEIQLGDHFLWQEKLRNYALFRDALERIDPGALQRDTAVPEGGPVY